MGYNSADGRTEIIAVEGQTELDFVFKIYTDRDVDVWLTPAGQSPDDTTDLLILHVDYEIVVNGDNGGKVTLISPTSAGDNIDLIRHLEPTRDIEYQTNGDFRPEVLNADQNYQTYLIADSIYASSNYLRVPLARLEAWNAQAEKMTANSYADEPVDVFVKQYFSNGDGTFGYTDSTNYSSFHWATKSGGSSVKTNGVVYVNTIDELSVIDITENTVAIVRDYKKGGTFKYDPARSIENDGGTVFNGWVRQYIGAVYIEWWDYTTSFHVNTVFGLFSDVVFDIDFVADTTIVLNANNSIKGKGSIKASPTFNGTKKTYTYGGASYDNYPLVFASGADNISLDGIELSCKDNGMIADASSCILLEECTNTMIKHCHIHDNYQTGTNGSLNGGAIFLVGGNTNKIDKCFIHSIGGEGVHTRADNTFVTDCTLDTSTSSLIGSQRYGIDGSRQGTVLVAIGNILRNAANSSISCNVSYSLIDSNVVEDCGIGIILGHRTTFATRANSSYTVCSNNVIKNIQRYGIRHAYGENITISGNTVTHWSLDGLDDISDSAIGSGSWAGSANIIGNSVSFGYMGIYCTGNATDIDETVSAVFLIEGNTVSDIKSYPIRIGNMNSAIINGNIIKRYAETSSSSHAGINMYGDKANCHNADISINGNIIGEDGSTETAGMRLSPTGTGDDITWSVSNNIMSTVSGIIIASSELSQVSMANNIQADHRGVGGLYSAAAGSSVFTIGYRKAILINNPAAQTITDINSKVNIGETISIITTNSNTTFVSTGNMTLSSNYTPSNRFVLTLLRYSETEYIELSRTS